MVDGPGRKSAKTNWPGRRRCRTTVTTRSEDQLTANQKYKGVGPSSPAPLRPAAEEPGGLACGGDRARQDALPPRSSSPGRRRAV